MNKENFVNENEELQLKLLKELCLIPAPSHKEEKRAEYCKKILESFGAENVYIDEALNVVYPVNCEGSNEITVFEGHTDTVFPDLEPLPYEEKDGKIFCPGVGDDTAAAVDILLMAKYIIENNIKPDKGILLVCNSCEEGLGNLKGTRQIFKDYKGRVKQFVTMDAVLDVIHHVTVGSHRYEITVKTEGGHSFDNFGNRSAIHELAKLISKIYCIDVPKNDTHKTTFNVGIIEGGTSVNTIAQEAKMLCEYRSDDVTALSYMETQFKKIFDEARNEGVELEVERIGERPCADGLDMDKQAELIEACKREIESVIGGEVSLVSASTDSNIPQSMGIPAIAIGVISGAGVHTREEYIFKNSLKPGLLVALKVMEKLCF